MVNIKGHYDIDENVRAFLVRSREKVIGQNNLNSHYDT